MCALSLSLSIIYELSLYLCSLYMCALFICVLSLYVCSHFVVYLMGTKFTLSTLQFTLSTLQFTVYLLSIQCLSVFHLYFNLSFYSVLPWPEPTICCGLTLKWNQKVGPKWNQMVGLKWIQTRGPMAAKDRRPEGRRTEANGYNSLA